ncbi:protein-methionine-sulfoxide reductase catalytic subunit MsrP [Bacterioplanes sanyensis]|uniref:protein-methionine-sulfoxide reductase catalytic subunit MsrP n=1 Tax=Bacterioplanes sanyensis TaxID=1249553 RepID=UPI00167A8896|nr:protein-methionine-sulfoxide reductase catalytic subunit MsrP [Bacterioplanes sanyensis]GGY52516.1 protein-methionine-sulfoxide reductase catalytic subunit MsrP [Bacterioplanes sanyensis]
MLIRKDRFSTPPSSEITPHSVYLKRRLFMQAGALSLLAAASPAKALIDADKGRDPSSPAWLAKQVGAAKPFAGELQESLTPYNNVTGYNNFYEFGTDKSDPARYAHKLTTDPWSVTVSGECDNTGTFALEDLLSKVQLEERVYRLRCVEAWSMVIPWIGFPLAQLIKQCQPNSRAKYVAFETLQRPKEMPGQRSVFATIDWPYIEGLRMDEAMNDLTLMAVGLYGEMLPNQNGAPIRLVVPWKYGFKSIKSIVRIHFSETKPATTWNLLAPNEYGFYANVNPKVDHPRWSQASERRLPSSLFSPNRIPTQMFNGYQQQVAHLYKGMDLEVNY